MHFNEDFLHYIWQYRLLGKADLRCTNGDQLQIISQGLPNRHAGPDFSTAKLKINGQLWVGNVEIHLKSSDWKLHRHHTDRFYDTVILHVVYEDDDLVCRTDGTIVPALSLKGLVPETLLIRYKSLITEKDFFPCAGMIGSVDRAVLNRTMEKMIAERLEERAVEISVKMEHNHHHWRESFHVLLMRCFGFKTNNIPFEMLANSIPGSILSKLRDNPLQVEALLFGQAGFLEGEFKDEYPRKLQMEYNFLRHKYTLQPANRSVWKFMRMHPQNFPVLRIAQLAGLLTGSNTIFDDSLACKDHKSMIGLFSSVAVNPYWKNHSGFDRDCGAITVQLGRKSIENLVINAICTLLYSYGRYFDREDLKGRAVKILKKIPAERNAIVAEYKKAGLALRSAMDSQAVLQLHKSYCSQKKCLGCEIGMRIMTG